jgi:hypothetical protein
MPPRVCTFANGLIPHIIYYVCMYVCMYSFVCLLRDGLIIYRQFVCLWVRDIVHAHTNILIMKHIQFSTWLCTHISYDMYVCMHVCMHLAYVCSYVCIFICKCKHSSTFIVVSVCMYVSMYVYICVSACMYVKYIHIYIRTHIVIFITHVHT